MDLTFSEEQRAFQQPRKEFADKNWHPTPKNGMKNIFSPSTHYAKQPPWFRRYLCTSRCRRHDLSVWIAP